MGDDKSARATLALVSTLLSLSHKPIAKPNIVAAIVKLMCLRIVKPPNGRVWTIFEEPV
jgi:hypothetical protein